VSTYITNGFILNVKPWREGDRLYTLFTDSAGKVEAVASGSRKVSSKLSPHLVPFSEINLMVARGRQRDRLASASLLQAYLKPPFNLPTMVLGSALLEVTDALTRVGEREPRLLNLLRQCLIDLSQLPHKEDEWRPAARWLLANYLVEIFKYTGLAITLTHCEHCRGELTEPVFFSWTSHGFYHQTHLPPGDTTAVLVPEVLAWLIKAAGLGVSQTEGLPAPVLAFLTDYVQGHSGQELYTIKVLRSIL